MDLTSQRVVVIGTAGAGKSVMARSLSAQFDLAYVARDEILGPGQGSAEHRRAVDRATAGDGWVFDGTPFDVEDLVYGRANVVVFLDYSRMTVTWRSWRRTIRILVSGRPDGPHSRESPLRWLDPAHPVRWSWSSQPRRRTQLRAVVKSSTTAHAERHHFTRPRDTARWLATIESEPSG
jgi:adenylate kinase family enzyme